MHSNHTLHLIGIHRQQHLSVDTWYSGFLECYSDHAVMQEQKQALEAPTVGVLHLKKAVAYSRNRLGLGALGDSHRYMSDFLDECNLCKRLKS